MVIDHRNFDCCSTEVGYFVVIHLNALNIFNYIATATGKNNSLEKTLFARIIDGNLVYKSGESDFSVFPGLPVYITTILYLNSIY